MIFLECNSCFNTSQFPDADIDESGQCHKCRLLNTSQSNDMPDSINFEDLYNVAEKIKREHTGTYDCIIGISGGLDSSYMAYIAGKLMGLNALLVHYDHGFFYDTAKENITAISKSLGLELRIIKSKKQWDRRYINSIINAFSKTGFYWGICTFCHYILPAAIVKVGREENIKFFMSHQNKYELSMHVPRSFKLSAMIKGIRNGGILSIPRMVFHLLLSQYYLLRLKLEFYVPPIKNLFRESPIKPFKTINLTKYVSWNIGRMITDLTRETGWKTPDHPNLGMRFDCMIEDSYINSTYKRATGSTVHAILANNLIHDGIMNKSQLDPVARYYDEQIEQQLSEVGKKVRNKNA